jgi:hypothetical protein
MKMRIVLTLSLCTMAATALVGAATAVVGTAGRPVPSAAQTADVGWD